ncbi:MAG: hypothetical protein P0116_13420 [Candidatus Nitrosocosmicus sp.]|nr:hypothetical protein [Candidatus Nitrosocosmicus sp.]
MFIQLTVRMQTQIIYNSNYNISSLPFSDQSKPAYLIDNSKINPTKHVVRIDNATKPFVLLFSETYDPLWTASIVGDGGSDNATNGNNGDQQSPKNYRQCSTIFHSEWLFN